MPLDREASPPTPLPPPAKPLFTTRLSAPAQRLKKGGGVHVHLLLEQCNDGATFRQLFVMDLGHEEPTILITNDLQTTPAKLITRYAQRMLIENALSDAVRFFYMDALSSSVGLKVDFDMALLVVASGLYRLLAQRMPATPMRRPAVSSAISSTPPPT